VKKSLRKLNLSRETLRALESPALDHVGGGIALSVKTTCTIQTGPNSCECTFSCPNLCPSLERTCTI
jgi:hypothetical protein